MTLAPMADLSTLDLNLLRVFDAVARERHVTRAAQRLNLSQPAVSNALARLRLALKDELFLRRPGGVEATELALSLTAPVAEVLDRLREALTSQAPFEPATSDRVFPLGMSEYAEAVLAPPLLERLAREAPHCLLTISHADRVGALDLLEADQVQLVVGMLAEPPALYTRLRLLPEAFLLLMRPGHPLAEGAIDLARFTAFPHLLHSPNGSRDGALDAPLREAGFPRRLGAVVAHLSAVPGILRRTDMVMALSARLAQQMAEAHGLAVRPCPVAVPHTRLSLIFPRRFEADQGHAWLRRLLLSVAREATPRDQCEALREMGVPGPAADDD
jgi:DNA-binding transcriptional LysR family regulator